MLGVAMPRSGPKTQHLTLLLLRESVAEFEDALDNPTELEAFELAGGVAFEGRLFVQRRSSHPPAWLDFVRTGTAEELTGLVNSGTAAVLLLRAAGRMFALTFGYGRWLLKPDSFVRDFGLKVVLNTVDPDRLRSVELRVIEDIVISRRTDASRASSPGSFGLDPGRDILRGVAGQPRDPALYGRQIVGSDAAVAGLKVEFGDLADVAARFFAAYNDTLYRQRFGWVDHVKLVKDGTRIDELNRTLIDALRDDGPRPYLAPPSMLAWANVEFGYTRDRDRHPDLSIEDYLANIDGAELDIETLRRHDVRVFAVDSNLEQDHWSVYSCLVFESKLGDTAFVLSEGQWLEVAANLAEEVRAGVGNIPKSGLVLPAARDGEWEEDYNQRAASGTPDRALLDQVLSRVAAERGPIEICDILTERGEFVHVKRKTQSATLSHLFSQGRISAEVFRRDPEVRDRLRALLSGMHPGIAARIPDSASRVQTDEFEVVYGVITAHPGGFPQNLPFFSRLNLLRTYEYLTGTLGYRTSVLGIGIET